jgi:Clp amino terminal domain, pathogenicity island component
MLLGVFERLTKPARQVVVLAQEEARRLKHDYVGTEHLLLGLLREEDGRAARALASLDVTYESARRQVVRIVGAGEKDSPDQMPFTTPAKQNLELALHEALSLGHDYIGTEHLLLGLVSQSESVASEILRDSNADPETVRDAVLLTFAGSDVGPPEPQIPADDPAADDHGPRAASEVAASGTYASGLALARAFGSTVLEPSWWPEDVEEIRCSLARFSTAPARYEILSTRRDGTPVGVIGHVDRSGGRSPREWLDEEWSEPPELEQLRGLIGRVGVPARLQGVIYDQELQLHLIGYDTEDEILSTVKSLRRVNPT